MGMYTSLRIEAPAEPRTVFAAALKAINVDPDKAGQEHGDYTDAAGTIWSFNRDDETCGTTLHFRNDNQPLPYDDYGYGLAYLVVEFDTGMFTGDNTEQRHEQRHRELVHTFGTWLNKQQLPWRYRHSFEGVPWHEASTSEGS